MEGFGANGELIWGPMDGVEQSTPRNIELSCAAQTSGQVLKGEHGLIVEDTRVSSHPYW